MEAGIIFNGYWHEKASIAAWFLWQVPSNPVDTLRIAYTEIRLPVFHVAGKSRFASSKRLSCGKDFTVSFSCVPRCQVFCWLAKRGRGWFVWQTLTSLRWSVARRWWWFVHGLLVSASYGFTLPNINSSHLKRCYLKQGKNLAQHVWGNFGFGDMFACYAIHPEQ